ncbi:Retrovirus-related Pol polyprotein from transposon TNT 1-94 [Gossypium australe]|uniref:Retrovirus-related Pol polyprotein from transposon TNT 1-94 n=1 Tax=Gossypium australe TaxID=47621 RepID=A0A5B6W6C1_9ROSI|nr:Retrovirus-related Pol polyprotein from transposon TNT 1-94 [Gossypium australe]
MTPTRLPTSTPVHNEIFRSITNSNHSTPLIRSSSTTTPLFNPTPSQIPSTISTTLSPQPTTHQPPVPPTTTQPNSHAMITHSKAGIFKPKAYLTKADFLTNDTHVDIHEAIQSECWQAAVHSELHALLRNNTWRLWAVGCKWLFKVKKKADGTVDSYKARLVAKGFSQHAGLDFHDTFSPMIDVNNAFLNGDLTDDIYMEQPPGFEVPGANGQQLLNFNASKADPSLFIRTSSENVVLLMVYVDDIVITGSSNVEVNSVVQHLHNKFNLKDMWQLSFFLGLEVQHTSLGVFLNQKKYILEILTKIGMVGAAATPTPMVNTPKLTASDSIPPFIDVHLYRSTVGMLQYLCITRPDLSFYVNKLSQYMNLPSEMHWLAVNRVLRYLIGTFDHGLYFSKGRIELVCYSNVDWASSVEDRLSTTGYVVYLGPNPIAWSSKKQSVVSRSSSEAEYRSLANCVSELLWVKQMIDEIGVSSCPPPVIWCHNTSTVSIAANPTHHSRIKHVEIDHHFVREKVLDGTLQVNFVPSSEQVIDVLTKPITPKQFESFRQAL